MKRVLLFICFWLPGIIAAQEQPDSYIGELPIRGGRINYIGVDSVPGVDKSELYNRAKTFLSMAFPNFKDVVKLDDREMGKITIRGLFNTAQMPKKVKGFALVSYIECYAMTDIYVKDGRYKYEISDFVVPSNSLAVNDFPLEQTMYNKKKAMKVSGQLSPYMNDYITALQAAMKGRSANNW